MALSPGTRLGPHEIVVAIGEGGMGQVYRARDTRLGRDVAIKVLPPALRQEPGASGSPHRVRRGSRRQRSRLGPARHHRHRHPFRAAARREDRFTAGEPVDLFKPRLSGVSTQTEQFAPHPSGKRFLVLDVVGGDRALSIGMILNWPAILKPATSAR